MPQYGIVVAPTATSPLQEPINLSTGGNLAVVGNPGSPGVFALFGQVFVPGLAATNLGRSVVNNYVRTT